MLRTDQLELLYARVHEEGRLKRESAGMMYLFGQTPENESSVLDAAAAFEGLIGLIGERFDQAGYPGYPAWERGLLARGISRDRIVPICGSLRTIGGKTVIHTLSEAEALVAHALQARLRDVILVAPHWHLVRAFMTTVMVALQNYPELRIYAQAGKALAWDQLATHSQGTLTGTRADFVFHETVRIFRYHEQGTVPDPAAVLAYMDQRGR